MITGADWLGHPVGRWKKQVGGSTGEGTHVKREGITGQMRVLSADLIVPLLIYDQKYFILYEQMFPSPDLGSEFRITLSISILIWSVEFLIL